MVSKSTLLSSLLLASAALAVPSSLVEAPIARGREDHQPRHIDFVASRADAAADVKQKQTHMPNQNWAGAAARASDLQPNFNLVTGTIAVPRSHNLSVWIGMDLFACRTSSIKLGVKVNMELAVPKFVWFYSLGYQVIPIPEGEFLISPGDELGATIKIVNPTEVALSLHNNQNGTVFYRHICGVTFCQQDVEWGVEGTDMATFLNFTGTTIVNAYVCYIDGTCDNARNAANVIIEVGEELDENCDLLYTKTRTTKNTVFIEPR